MYADEGNKPEGWSATQLAASGLIDVERTLVVEHLRNLFINTLSYGYILQKCNGAFSLLVERL